MSNNLNKLAIFLGIISFLFVSCSKDNADENEEIDSEITISQKLEFNGMLSGFVEADRLGLTFASADFYPTGLYAPPNTVLKLKLEGNSNNQDVSLMVGTYSQSDFWNFEPAHFTLKNGDNEINSGSMGGMVYIKYYDDAENKISIDFAGGFKKAAFYMKNKTSASDWVQMLSDTKEVPFATLVGDNSIIVVSNAKATLFQDQDQNVLLNNIDRAISIENDISGMDGSSEVHQVMKHKTLFVEYGNTDYYMFAYNYRTAYNFLDGVQFVLDNDKFSKDGWGPWHEVGHTRQMNAWTWNEVVEVTVNIYSLAVEKEFGFESRLKRDNVWASIHAYLQLEEENKDYNSQQVGLFERLGLFHQLQLAYGDDYYKNLHKMFREEKPVVVDDNDRMRLFMVNASRVANNDLSTFFKKWGLKFSDSQRAYDEISALGLSAPDSDLTLLRD